MYSIRLHLLRNPNNHLVRVSSSPGTLMRRAEKRQCIRSHYTSNTILEQTATQVHVETVSKAWVTIWSRHRTTSSTETAPHGCPLSFTVLNWLIWLSVQILLHLRTYKPLKIHLLRLLGGTLSVQIGYPVCQLFFTIFYVSSKLH